MRKSGDFSSGLRPPAQVLRQFRTRLEKDQVVSCDERFVTRVRPFKGFGKIVVASDATSIEVFGKQEDAEGVYDPDRHPDVRGSKRDRRCNVPNNVPLGFLRASRASEGAQLLELVANAKELIGVESQRERGARNDRPVQGAVIA